MTSSDGLSVTARGLLLDHDTAAGRLRALDLPRLDLPAGASLAVTGPSGSGKSTLLALIAGLEVPTAGSLGIGGTDLARLDNAARTQFRRHRIGIVFQRDNLLPFLTVSENVRLRLALAGRTAGAAERTKALLARLGLQELCARLPDALSGGQRQRAAVARALAHEPGLILADEPTGAIDRAAGGRVLDLLLEARSTLGATLIVATHDPDLAASMDFRLQLTPGCPAPETDQPNVR